MKRQIIFVFGLVFVFSGLSFGQGKTVTNADLEKFKQKRLAAEKELKENILKRNSVFKNTRKKKSIEPNFS